MGAPNRENAHNVCPSMAKLAIIAVGVLTIVAMVASFPLDDDFAAPSEFVAQRIVEDDLSLQPKQVFKDIADALDVTHPKKEILPPLVTMADSQGRPEWMPEHSSHK